MQVKEKMSDEHAFKIKQRRVLSLISQITSKQHISLSFMLYCFEFCIRIHLLLRHVVLSLLLPSHQCYSPLSVLRLI